MTEYELYDRVMKAANWAAPEADRCRCGGSGWVLSDCDAWYQCPYHEGIHPELLDDMAYDDVEELPVEDVEELPVEDVEEICPF